MQNFSQISNFIISKIFNGLIFKRIRLLKRKLGFYCSQRIGALRGCGLNMPKLSIKNQCSKIGNKLEFCTLPRNLAKLLLYAVPSIRQGWFFGMERRKFILFLSVGKSGKGNALFVFFVRNALGKKQNVHFPLRWAFLFIFFVT